MIITIMKIYTLTIKTNIQKDNHNSQEAQISNGFVQNETQDYCTFASYQLEIIWL